MFSEFSLPIRVLLFSWLIGDRIQSYSDRVDSVVLSSFPARTVPEHAWPAEEDQEDWVKVNKLLGNLFEWVLDEQGRHGSPEQTSLEDCRRVDNQENLNDKQSQLSNSVQSSLGYEGAIPRSVHI